MEKRALSGSAKRKQRKEKEAKDAALVQHIPSILTRFQLTSLQLQKADIELMTAVRLLILLRDFVSAQRGLFTDFENEALAVPGVCQACARRTNMTSSAPESANDLRMTAQKKMRYLMGKANYK